VLVNLLSVQLQSHAHATYDSTKRLSVSPLCRSFSNHIDVDVVVQKNRQRNGSEVIFREGRTHSKMRNSSHRSVVRRRAEMREQQSSDFNAGPSIILGGFLVAEMPIIRQTLDEAGAYGLQMIVSHPDLLDVSVGDVLRNEREPEWLHPVPDVWVDGGGWGKRRVLLFHDVPRVNQLEIVQILYDIGIPPRIDLMSLDGSVICDEAMKLGDVFGMAMDMGRQSVDDIEFDDYYLDDDDDDDDMIEEDINYYTNDDDDDDEVLSPCTDLSPDILHLTAIDAIAERTVINDLVDDDQDISIDDDD
jgi:hypothetical protein